jgi:hypothetical protein
MRSNSGRGKSRSDLHDPTLRDQSLGRAESPESRNPKAPADQRQGRKD